MKQYVLLFFHFPPASPTLKAIPRISLPNCITDNGLRISTNGERYSRGHARALKNRGGRSARRKRVPAAVYRETNYSNGSHKNKPRFARPKLLRGQGRATVFPSLADLSNGARSDGSRWLRLSSSSSASFSEILVSVSALGSTKVKTTRHVAKAWEGEGHGGGGAILAEDKEA